MNFSWQCAFGLWTIATVFTVASVLILKEVVGHEIKTAYKITRRMVKWLRMVELGKKALMVSMFGKTIEKIGRTIGLEVRYGLAGFEKMSNPVWVVTISVVCWKILVEMGEFCGNWIRNINQNPLLDREPASWSEAVNVVIWVILAGIPGR